MKITKRTRNKIKYTLYFVLFMIGLFAIRYLYLRFDNSPISMSSHTEKIKVKYLYHMDGDTAVFKDENNNEITCRFLGVDAPEHGQEGYVQASNYTDMALSSAFEIILELEPKSDKYDKFDRLLAWVWTDGYLLQAKLVENDLAQIKYLYNNYLYTEYLFKVKTQKNVTK